MGKISTLVLLLLTLNISSGQVSSALDFDGDGSVKPLTDGLLNLRHAFNFTGDTLINNAVESTCTRCTSELIDSYIQAKSNDQTLDIDGDGTVKPLTDALLLLRYLFGFRGDTLIAGAVDNNAIRTTATAIESYIESALLDTDSDLAESTYDLPITQEACINTISMIERVAVIKEDKLALTHPLFESSANSMTYCSDHVDEYGAAFEMKFVSQEEAGAFQGYPNGLVGGHQKGKWNHSNPRLTGMPVLLGDLKDDMVLQWKISQEDAWGDAETDDEGDTDKWMASINMIFDDGEATAKPDGDHRFYDVVIELNSHLFTHDFNDTDLILDPDAKKRNFYARNENGGLRTFNIVVGGNVYKFAVRYKFFNDSQGVAKSDKVHVKYIPITDANIPPYLNHSVKAFIDNSKEFIQYARMPEADRNLANEKVAKSHLYLKSIRAGYEVYRGESTLRNDYFRIMKPDTPNVAPTITGIAETSTNVHNHYQFLPTASDVHYDVLIFSIENKPSWADFDVITGLLEGAAIEGGSSTNIIISVTDGDFSVSLAPFDIEVLPAIDLAHQYGKAIQGKTRSGKSASLAIDADATTYSYTENNSGKNWWQVKLPKETLVSKVMVQGLHNEARLAGAKVYLTKTAYDGNAPADDRLIMTLEGNTTEQIKAFNSAKNRTYLFIQALEGKTLGLGSVEVYGTSPVAPVFESEDYTVTIDKWQNKTQGFFNVNVVDYQEDVVTYSIDSDVPFRVDTEGNLIVDGLLLVQDYTFDVLASDGINSAAMQSVVVTVQSTPITTEPLRAASTSPALNGYLPNTYTDGDTVSITVQGRSYAVTVNADETWSINADAIAPALATGSYDVTLIVAGEEIRYSDYLEVYASLLKASDYNLAMHSIADVAVDVEAHQETPLGIGVKVRGTSISLKVEDGVTTLENKSYREIKSLLASYLDGNGDTVFLKLNFNQNILPYSVNTLTSFTHDAEIQIVPTANMFDMEFSFEGDDCSGGVGGDKYYYCQPTNAEKTSYSIYLSMYNHFYNSVNGLAVMKAWVENKSYKTLAVNEYTYLASDYFSDDATILNYYYRNLYDVLIPNMSMELKSLQGWGTAGGKGNDRTNFTLFGDKKGSGFASVNESSLAKTDSSSAYQFTHHEMYHGLAYEHNEGMSYGWSDTVQNAANQLDSYTIGVNTVIDVPKYIVESNYVQNDKIQLTVHKTSDATQSDVTFEVLSTSGFSDDTVVFEKGADDGANQITFTTQDSILARHFIRIYASDSDEVMSLFIRPSNMTQTKMVSDVKTYHALSHAHWKRSIEVMDKTWRADTATGVCKAWFGEDARVAYEVEADLLNSNYQNVVDNANWLDSKKFVAGVDAEGGYKVYDYGSGTYVKSSISSNAVVIDDGLGVLCVE